MENVRKHIDIKLVTTDKRRNQLVSEPVYHTTKYFSEDLLIIEMKKIKVKMNKPIHLGMSILDISKTLMYEFWYGYIVKKWFDTSNYSEDNKIPFPRGMNKKVIKLMTDELGWKIMTEFVALNSKTYSYLTDDDNNVKKAKGTKNV